MLHENDKHLSLVKVQGGFIMQKDEYWKQFVTTGRVFDYLNFKEKEFKKKSFFQRGETNYGTTYSFDRDGIISNSDRRLR